MKPILILATACISLSLHAQNNPDKMAGKDSLAIQEISSVKALEEITIVSKKPTIRVEDEKKVFAVNQSLVSVGGNATDLLRNIPTLQIDASGAVSLRGSNDVRVFVDGKPSLIAGGTIQQILQAIPAASIENVEIITNPSARYNAEGQSIINIVLKKNRKLGLTGSGALTVGTRSNYTGNANLGFQSRKINLYADYTFQQTKTYSNGFQNMTFREGTETTGFSNETFPSTTRTPGHNARAGIDFSVAGKTIIGLSAGLNSNDSHRTEALAIDQLNGSGQPVQFFQRDNLLKGSIASCDLNLDFNQKFTKPGAELTFNFNFSRGTVRNQHTFWSILVDLNGSQADTTFGTVKNQIYRQNRNYNVQIDYVLPIGAAGKIEAGYRGQSAFGDNNQKVFNRNPDLENDVPDLRFTNFFDSDNKLHALYFSYKNQIGNFSYQLGLRAEDADLRATIAGYDSSAIFRQQPVRVRNKGFYPSVSLTRKLDDTQQLKFNYARRVTRPNPREVNTFPDISDPVNYDVGNPRILPQNMHSAEIGYTKNWENVSLTSSVYYTRISNVIKRVESDPIDGVIITSSQNMRKAVNSGVEVIGHFDLSKVWDFTVNTNIYYRQNSAAPEFGVRKTSTVSWNANITNNVRLAKDLSIQVRFDYRAPDFIFQDHYRPAFGVDGAAKYDFPKKKASLSFTARDIFYSRQWAFLRASDTVLLDFRRMSQSSRASLTYAYRFGRIPRESKKSRKPDAAEKRIDERP